MFQSILVLIHEICIINLPKVLLYDFLQIVLMKIFNNISDVLMAFQCNHFTICFYQNFSAKDDISRDAIIFIPLPAA